MLKYDLKRISLAALLFTAFAQTCSGQNQDIVIPGNLYLINAVRVAAEDPGIIRSVVTVGDKIDSGQSIAQLNFELYAAQRDAAEKELEAAELEAGNDVDQQFAKVSSEVNRRVLQRSIAANQQYRKAVSLTEIERLKLELKRSELSGEQADRTGKVKGINQELKSEELKIAKLRLRNREIRSPIEGIVTEVSGQVGQWVNAGQTIAKVINTDQLRFSGLADRDELLPNQVSDQGTLIVEFRDEATEELEVTITFVSPEIDPSSGLYEVHAEIANSDQLLFAGMRAKLLLKPRTRCAPIQTRRTRE